MADPDSEKAIMRRLNMHAEDARRCGAAFDEDPEDNYGWLWHQLPASVSRLWTDRGN